MTRTIFEPTVRSAAEPPEARGLGALPAPSPLFTGVVIHEA